MTTTDTRTTAADIDTAYFRSVDPFDGQPDPDRGGGDQAATKIWVDPCSIGDGLDVTLTIDRTNIRLDMSADEARKLATLVAAAARTSTYEQDVARAEAHAAANEPVDASELSCQGLANVDPTYSKPIFHPGAEGRYVTGYAEKMARLGEGHVYSCDLIGHGIED